MGSTAAITQLAGAGASAASTGIGAYNQSQAMSAQGRFSRTFGNLNANMSDLQAGDAMRRGDLAASRQMLRTSMLVGSQRAAAAGQGVDVNSGSALDLQAQARRMGVLDANTIKMNAYKEAMGMRMQGANSRLRGDLSYMAGRNNATNTLLAGGLNMARQGYGAADNYYRYRPPMQVPSPEANGNPDPWADNRYE